MNDDIEDMSPSDEYHYLKRNYIASQYRIASVAYALVICLTGIVLITIEPFKACTRCGRDVKIFVDSFFIYMYVGSIVWIVIMLALIIVAKRQQKIAIKHPTGMNRRLSTTFKVHNFKATKAQAERLRDRSGDKKKKANFFENFEEKKSLLSNFLHRSKKTPTSMESSPPPGTHHLPPHRDSIETNASSIITQLPTTGHFHMAQTSPALMHHVASESDFAGVNRFNAVTSAAVAANNNKFYFTYDYENGTGELYMRVGTAIFAMCSLIDRSLSLIQMFESYFDNQYSALTPECRLTFVLSTVKIVCSFVFIFMQTFFIFKYANIVINYGKNSAVIGLMHIMCTNFVVFIRTVILETVSEIRHHYHEYHLLNNITTDHHAATAYNHNYGHHEKATKSTQHLTTHYPNEYGQTYEFMGNHTENVTYLPDSKLGCINNYLISTEVSIGVQEAQERLGPYLYPCVIEYSLMCMTVFYILWASIEQRYNMKNSLGGWVKPGTGTNQNTAPQTGGSTPNTCTACGVVAASPNLIEKNPTNAMSSQQSAGSTHIEINNSLANNINKISQSQTGKTHIYEKNPNLKTAILNNANQATTSAPRRPSYRYSLSFEKRYANQFVIDCGKSTTGLFFGILTVLITLISLITYFIYRGASKERATQLSEATELILVILSLITNIVTILKLKMVKFDHKISYSMGYNETLVLIGLAGVYLFSFYTIIAVLENGLTTHIEKLSFSIQVTTLVESTIQAIFIINGCKMFTRDSHIRKSKPGRSFVTLLILINVSLWMSDTFSVKKYDMNTIQLDYYNVVFWSIASSISSPLAIFYRFHASVCLSDMWKTLYE